MSVIWYPPPIQWRRDACNTMTPSATFLQRAVAAENHLTAYRHKEVFSCDWLLGDSTSGYGFGPLTMRRWRFRSGHGAVRLRAMITIGQVYGAVSLPSDPTTQIDVTLSGGATTTMGPWRYGVSPAGPSNDSPSTWHVSAKTIAIAANSVYECSLIVNDYARPLGLSVYELGDPTIAEAVPYYNQDTPQAGGPIYDAGRSKLLVGVDNMLRHNGATAFHWGPRDGSARTRTTATAINIIDNATTGAPTAATPGFSIDTTYRRTASRTTVPIELAVYGSVPAGTGTVTLVNSAGTVIATATINSATPGWFTSTGNVTAGVDKFDIQLTGDGVNSTSVYAVSVIEWET